jgi:hypothetical protein
VRVTLLRSGDELGGEGLERALLRFLLFAFLRIALGGRLGGAILSLSVPLVLVEEDHDCPSIHWPTTGGPGEECPNDVGVGDIGELGALF